MSNSYVASFSGNYSRKCTFFLQREMHRKRALLGGRPAALFTTPAIFAKEMEFIRYAVQTTTPSGLGTSESGWYPLRP
jgi:hypothetical protein